MNLTHFRILQIIARSSPPVLSAAVYAQLCKIAIHPTQDSFWVILNGLEKAGWISRQKDSHQKIPPRKVIILTPKGQQLVDQFKDSKPAAPMPDSADLEKQLIRWRKSNGLEEFIGLDQLHRLQQQILDWQMGIANDPQIE